METYQRYFLKLKKDTNEIAAFGSVSSVEYKESDYTASEFFTWVEYSQMREEYEEDFVIKAKWSAIINDIDFGDLESLVLGAVIDFDNNAILPPSE